MPVKDKTQLDVRSSRSIKKETKVEKKNYLYFYFIAASIFLALFIEAASIFLLKNYQEVYMNTLQLISYDLIILGFSSCLLYFCYYFKIGISIKIAFISFIILTLSNLIFPFIDLDYRTYLFWFQSLSIGSGLSALLTSGITWRMKYKG